MVSQRTRRFQRSRLIAFSILLVLASCVAVEILYPGWLIYPGIGPLSGGVLAALLLFRFTPIDTRRLRAFPRLKQRRELHASERYLVN